jgi:hypothetical protein
MNAPAQNILINRYPGVKPFSEKEQFLFFGRENDLEALNSLIFVKQTVVLYGKSGYGKSSLINAGIIPRLKNNESWVHFSIRFNNYSEKEAIQNVSPSQTTKQRFAATISKKTGSGFYQIITNEDSFWYWIKLNQLESNKSKFILFFDQFEELFTYPREQVAEFSEQLSQLLYNTVPAKFRKKIAELDETDAISDELNDFVYDKPEIKVIFSIRSDRMSLMNSLTDKHPFILQNCYLLDALSIDAAASAITEPAKLSSENGFSTPPFEFAKGAVDKILNSIANPEDGKIEAATLQIVCRYIENTIVAEKGNRLVTEDILGNITDIFQQYYESIVNKLPPGERIKAQHLIEDELIEGGRRNPLTAGYIQKKFGLGQDLLAELENSSLLRKERDAAGRLLYEISHDTLIAAISKVADSRRKAEDEIKKQEAEIRKKELEKEIEEERKRADQLAELNERAKSRTRIAAGLAIACILIASLAVISWIKATESESKAKKNEAQAKAAQYESERAFATLYTDKGDKYFYGRGITADPEMAYNMYDTARKILINHKEDTLFKQIEKQMSLCIEKLPK